MGKFRIPARYFLGLFSAAFIAFPALASTVSLDVSPTTGYSVTNRTTTALPPRTVSGPVANYNPTLGPLAGGGAYQTTSSGITITGVKGNTGTTTMSGRIIAGANAMKNGAVRCLTSFRCNAALFAGAVGLNALFNGLDWVMGEGGEINKTSPYYSNFTGQAPPVGAGYRAADWISMGSAVCGTYGLCVPTSTYNGLYCPYTSSSNKLFGYAVNTSTSGSCYYNAEGAPKIAIPVSGSEISSGVNSNYNPDPSDLPFLSTGGLDFSASDVNFEVQDIPSISGASNPTVTQYPDGSTLESYTDFDFSVSNNPSKQPTVSVEETTRETTYDPLGAPVGTTTTTTTNTGNPDAVEPESPTDCDFMPTVCRFLEWFQEPDPELQQEPDFNQLIDDVDIDRHFQVGSSTAGCPAPFEISLSWVPSVSVSLQPFCDFADLMRPFYLSLCFLFSGMIILRT